jgi:hypothetical protein
MSGDNNKSESEKQEILKSARDRFCKSNPDDGICQIFADTHNSFEKFIPPFKKSIGKVMGDAYGDMDIQPILSPEDLDKVLGDILNGDFGHQSDNEAGHSAAGIGKFKGAGHAQFINGVLKSNYARNYLRKALVNFKTSESTTPDYGHKGHDINRHKSFHNIMSHAGTPMRGDWVYDTEPPERAEDIVWLVDISGSMNDTLSFIQPVVDTLQDLGLKQRFFMGDTGDSFIEITPNSSFGQNIKKIGGGGTDIGEGISNAGKAVSGFRDKTLIVYSDTETGDNFVDEIKGITRQNGRVIILNPRKEGKFDFSKERNVREYDDLGLVKLGPVLDALNKSRTFIQRKV